MGLVDFLLGNKKRRITEFLKNGAVIVDVRTQKERDKGFIEGSKHVPLDQLKDTVEELRQMNKPIIVCCESGIRSEKAAHYLGLHNLEAINGGGWKSLKKLL